MDGDTVELTAGVDQCGAYIAGVGLGETLVMDRPIGSRGAVVGSDIVERVPSTVCSVDYLVKNDERPGV